MEEVVPRELSLSGPLCAGGGTNSEVINNALATRKQARVPIFISNLPLILSAKRGSMAFGSYFVS